MPLNPNLFLGLKKEVRVEDVFSLYRLNQAKARAEQWRKGLGSAETVAQFGAQFKLFSQGITNALAELFQHAGAEVLDQDVGLAQQLLQHLAASCLRLRVIDCLLRG